MRVKVVFYDASVATTTTTSTMATPTESRQPSVTRRPASVSRSHPPSRPTTPLRPSSRTSLRDSSSVKRCSSHDASDPAENPLKDLEPAFAELADGMADLEANFMHLQLMHESLARFTEDFGSLLYGMNVNAFCVDFPEVKSSSKHSIQLARLCVTRASRHPCRSPSSAPTLLRFLPKPLAQPRLSASITQKENLKQRSCKLTIPIIALIFCI